MKNQKVSVVDGELPIERVPRAVAAASLLKDRSLRPGLSMMDGCIEGNIEAQAIRDSWAFQFPVKVVSHEQHEAMLRRNPVTFHG